MCKFSSVLLFPYKLVLCVVWKAMAVVQHTGVSYVTSGADNLNKSYQSAGLEDFDYRVLKAADWLLVTSARTEPQPIFHTHSCASD